MSKQRLEPSRKEEDGSTLTCLEVVAFDLAIMMALVNVVDLLGTGIGVDTTPVLVIVVDLT